MRSREHLLLTGAALLALGIGYVVLGPGSSAGALPPPEPVAPEPPAPEPRAPDAVDGGPVAPSAVGLADPVFQRSEPVRDTSGWTSGVIQGDIELVASVVDKITSIEIVVDELKNLNVEGARPFRKVVPVERGIGTPTYRVTDVPFSSYGYLVRVHAPGLNGSQQTVAITEETPLASPVNLRISPGVPFSLWLRDQDHAPVVLTEVRMVPEGAPLGRTVFDGRTDNLGSVVFENVLAGDYQVLVGPPGQPLMEPPLVNVQPTSRTYRDNKVQGQGQKITVPRGVPLGVLVAESWSGYPVADATVRAQAIDRTRLLVLDGKTDRQGRVTFPNVVDGIWDVQVLKDGFDRSSRHVTIAGTAPPELQVALVRRR
jgi:hypothetical protein